MLRRSLLLPAILACVLARPAIAQTPALDQRLLMARSLYYTPTTAGLHTFSCTVSTDWKAFLTKASGNDVPDDNPLLVYLSSAHMTISDALSGEGKLQWSNPAVPAASIAESSAKMQEGLSQMFSGFFDSWNAYLNGTMVPAADKTTKLTAVNDGIHLHAVDGKITVDEDFDKNMLLTRAHVLTGDTDVDATPTFTDTPDGRVVVEIDSAVRQPSTAPPMLVGISVTYQNVATYRIPETIHYEVKNVAQLDFKLGDCTVNPSPTFSSPHPK